MKFIVITTRILNQSKFIYQVHESPDVIMDLLNCQILSILCNSLAVSAVVDRLL